jgi:HAMP domain-containing protein
MLWLSVLVAVLLALALVTLIVAVRGLAPAQIGISRVARRGVAKEPHI